MIFHECKLKGAYLIELNKIQDDRGYFARTFCRNEFAEHGLETDFVQCNVSSNLFRNTLRGMHYQGSPYEETKIVSCCKGSIYDVIIDLRKESDTYCKWESFELSAYNKRYLYIPKGFAHGYKTLEDDTDVFYMMTEFYISEYSCGVRWNDKQFNIQWPEYNKYIISTKDLQLGDYVK